MTLVVVGSVHGAPGATTTTLLLAGCLARGVVVEADLDGGVLAVRYGLAREPGLTTLAAARSVDPRSWLGHAQSAGGAPVLVGPDSPAKAAALWDRAGDHLAGLLAGADADVLVDGGRLRPGGMLGSLLPVCGLVVVVVRPDPEDLVALSHRLPELRGEGTVVGVVVAGRGPYSPGAVADQVGAEVLAELPHDRRAAETLSSRGGSPRALARSPLARAARSLADAVAKRTANVAQVGG
jgi:cellulose biosynthesis protein BcsQ